MPLFVIEDAKQVKLAYKKLKEKLISQSDKHGKINVGWFGGNMDLEVYWFAKHKFWWGSRIGQWGYWNPFGIGTENNEPEWNSGHSHNVTWQFNPLSSGNSWRKASTFVKDQDDRIYLAHTGKIGGGRKGIGKSTFEENFSGIQQWHTVQGSAGEKRTVIISELDDKNLIRNLALFTQEVKKIKELAIQGKLNQKPRFLLKNFNKEFEGQRMPYTQSQTIHANVSHGSIVNNLKIIAEKYGLDTYSNRAIDLYLANKSGATAMLEIKTDLDTESKYKAIGQLIYNSQLNNMPNLTLIAVFPHSTDTEFKRILDKLDIKYISYKWKNEKPVFDNKLNEFLESLKNKRK